MFILFSMKMESNHRHCSLTSSFHFICFRDNIKLAQGIYLICFNGSVISNCIDAIRVFPGSCYYKNVAMTILVCPSISLSSCITIIVFISESCHTLLFLPQYFGKIILKDFKKNIPIMGMLVLVFYACISQDCYQYFSFFPSIRRHMGAHYLISISLLTHMFVSHFHLLLYTVHILCPVFHWVICFFPVYLLEHVHTRDSKPLFYEV